MHREGFPRNFKPLEILTEENIQAIHRATLDVLWQTGIVFESKKALRLFQKHECKVDFESGRVCFPAGLVEESLRKCPSTFRIKSREPKNDIIVGANTVHFVTFPGMDTVNLDTWERRTPTRKEYCDALTVLDALDNLHCIGSYVPYFGFEGIPPCMRITEGVAAQLRNSTKPIHASGHAQDCEIFIIQMAQALGVEIGGNHNASDPLVWGDHEVNSMYRFAEAGLFVLTHGAPLMGATGPATITGSLVTTIAEDLAMIVLAQLLKPGMRVIAAPFAFPQNMKSGGPAFGEIGISLHQVAFNQIVQRYGIPTRNVAGGPSNSKRIDYQCAYEKTIPALTSALSGSSLVGFMGAIYGELTFHPVMAILDDDIAGMISRFLEGVAVNQETLALDLIDEVGPIPGNYLYTEHTRKWWRKEQFLPKAADSLTIPEWMETGKKSALEYGKERMEEILATHKPVPLTDRQEEDIERILEEARVYYRKKGLM